MKISARNAIKGKVVEVKTGAVAAQVRVDLAAAYAALGDWDSAELELAAAEAVF